MTLDLDLPWVEKYRPKRFEDIVSQNVAINNLKDFVSSGNMPHMIFTGPAGTGKTSTALIIAKTLLKGERYYRNLLELNASDTVRMQFVRDILKSFVNSDMMIDEDSLKIVILDEADNIPPQVQQALRRIIERTSSRVKFILICNYVNRIIDPIISRCAVFRFVKLSNEKIVERLEFIAKNEELSIPSNIEKEFFEAICFVSANDLRKAINTLQSAVALELSKNLDINEILRISGFIDEPTLENLIKAIQSQNFAEARKIILSIENFDSRNFIRQLSATLHKFEFDIKDKKIIYVLIGDIDYRISQGADDYIQILALIADIIKRVRKKS